MIKIKNIVLPVVIILVICVLALNYEKIYNKFDNFFGNNKEIVIKEGNPYERKYNYLFVKQVDDFEPNNYEDLRNIFYSILNKGWDEFTFYCPKSYEDCLTDVGKISNDNELLSNINDFISPYNSYSTIKTVYDENGEVTVKVSHLYNTREIEQIDKDIDQIIKDNIVETMTDVEKIRVLHDYIINNTKYDNNKANNLDSPYDSARISGLLYDHYAICSGYADTMAVILDKLNITNFKVSSSNHVWNAVYIDNNWYHLDLTWDDPVTTTGKDVLEHNYFLIDTDELKKQDDVTDTSSTDKNNHYFDQNIYLEFNN